MKMRELDFERLPSDLKEKVSNAMKEHGRVCEYCCDAYCQDDYGGWIHERCSVDEIAERVLGRNLFEKYSDEIDW